MTGAVREYVRKWAKQGSVLEIGSRDINGNVRDIFVGQNYTGIDVVSGPGVDEVVVAGQKLKYETGSFDLVLSLESLEHDDYFWVTIEEAKRVLKVGGRLILTVPWFYFPPHEEPGMPDMWRFSKQGIQRLLMPLTIIDLNEATGLKHVFAVAEKVSN